VKPPPADHPEKSPGSDPVSEAADGRRRALVLSLVGKKVSVSTTDFHHVVGHLVELGSDDRLKLLVKNREVYLRRQGVARIHEADPALAEYIK
jgi:hypothetical protein